MSSHGLSTQTVNSISGVLARFGEVDQAVLFGSRAKGNFKPGSDIDLALYGAGLSRQIIARIDEAMDDLLLPYEIDLADPMQIDNGELLEHIKRVGREFYRKT